MDKNKMSGLGPGEKNHMAKTTDKVVRLIRQEYAAGMRGEERGAIYGMTPGNYNKIGARRSWRHIRSEEPNE